MGIEAQYGFSGYNYQTNGCLDTYNTCFRKLVHFSNSVKNQGFGPKPLTLNSYIDVECDEVGDIFAMLVKDLTV